MNNEEVLIKTIKNVYPQIYAYATPTLDVNNGWIKIGYTERKNVNDRIKEQTNTAAFQLAYDLLWTVPSKFNNTDIWFKDKQLHTFLCKFKGVKKRPNSEWFYYNGTPEKSLSDLKDFLNHNHDQASETLEYQLRVEQLSAVNQTLAYIQANPYGEFLWNAKPRFGKTLTTYDLIRKLNADKVLIVTNRPAIANSWFDDFEKFIAWQTNYAFVSTSDSLNERSVMNRQEFINQNLKEKKKMIAFISLQDLKGAISFGGIYNKLSWVKELEWDLLVIDEAHEGVDTFKTNIAFENIQRHFTLHLSGTPFKAIAANKFSQDGIYNWSYADEQLAKETWQEIETENPYEKLPRLNLFSYQMSKMITDRVNQGAQISEENIDYAFDLNEFFETDEKGKLIHKNAVEKWLDTLSYNEKYPFSTADLRNELKHTFWLLNRVASANALKQLLEAHPIFKNYHIVLAVGDEQSNNTELHLQNQKSLQRVQNAIKTHEKTITLSVGQLTTGVTIPEWTAVLMLSNLKSPSMYMQAAFRAQNPWEYESDGEMYQKQNAYVFDFAPERTLTIYDEFANNLFCETSNGGGTSNDRKVNVRELLNFFPVIAEDSEGKMIQLDVNQVLTLPKVFKAHEVVSRGFMSNFLFQNVTGIFSSDKAQEILMQLNPVDTGKTVPRKVEGAVDMQGVKVDDQGDVKVDMSIVISETNARFGEKVYKKLESEVPKAIESACNVKSVDVSETLTKNFKETTQEVIKTLAIEQGLTPKAADQITNKCTQEFKEEVKKIEIQARIKQAEASIEYQREVSQAQHDKAKLAQIEANFKVTELQLTEQYTKDLLVAVDTKTRQLNQESSKRVFQKSEEKKKSVVEDEVRARLRGFARTIPSFLMAYGEPTTTLANFDTTIKNDVFKEVTGISLEQFRYLRDDCKFFEETVFDQSIQEFLNKRCKLSNYFDDTQEEDIFDYIPPQKTNQIFTPKKVVKMMVDFLEAKDPDIFKNPDKTFVDLYMKSGLYLTEIIKRLYIGLETIIPDERQRLKHIIENQVYGFAPTEIIYNISRNFIFGFYEKENHIDDSHIVFLDTTPYAKNEADMSFEAKCEQLFDKVNKK